MFEPSGQQIHVEPLEGSVENLQAAMFDDLSSRLLTLQKNESSGGNPSLLQDCMADIPANYSRNNHKQQVNQNVIQQVSTDQRHLFFQQADLYNRYVSQDRLSKPQQPKVSKVPSVTEMTFFDLSNAQHLNQLFTRLEDIQRQECLTGTDVGEMPQLLRGPVYPAQRKGPRDEELKDNGHGIQSGQRSGEASSSQVSSA